MFIFNFSGAYATHEASCDFDIGVFMKPTSEKGMTSYENIEPDVFFFILATPPRSRSIPPWLIWKSA